MVTVLLLGTLDTKGDEYAYLRDRLVELGCEVVLIDAGVLGEPTLAPDVSRAQVAEAAGVELAELRRSLDRGVAVEAMGRGAAALLASLYREGRFDGVMALGGSGAATIAAHAMRALPLGVPKLLVSTVASGDMRTYVGGSDLTVMHSVVDIAGVNRLSVRILGNAAAAMAGMVRADAGRIESSEKPFVGATMFGVTTPCVTRTRSLLEECGYEVAVFSANGVGGRTMESLMEQGVVNAVLDVTTTELADELVGGILSAGPERLQTARRLGLPQVVSLGALDMVNFGPPETVPERFEGRKLYRHSDSVTLMRTTPEECVEVGRVIARRLNGARGPCSVLVPLRGTSAISAEGRPFHDLEADRALFETLEEHLDQTVELVALDLHINDPEFATALAQTLHTNAERVA